MIQVTPSAISRAVDRRGLQMFVTAMLAAVLLGGVMLFAIWARTRVTEDGYRLSRLAREHQQLLREREALLVTVARLRGPGRLEAEARRLGLGPPAAGRTVVLVEEAAAELARTLVAARP